MSKLILPENPTLIVTVGLPYSGKTTWIRQMFSYSVPVVSPDAVRLAVHGVRFLGRCEVLTFPLARIQVRANFYAGHPEVCVDATNVTRQRRDFWLATEDDGIKWRTVFQYMSTPAEICLARARAAGDEEILPVIERMARTFEPLDSDELVVGRDYENIINVYDGKR